MLKYVNFLLIERLPGRGDGTGCIHAHIRHSYDRIYLQIKQPSNIFSLR